MIVCPKCRAGTLGRASSCHSCGESLDGAVDLNGEDLAGLVIEGKYELGDFLGEGAMGWVYRGLHLSLDSTIAVKLMKPSGDIDDSRDQRFELEARAASRLNHPHIISIIDFGRTGGGFSFIISEFLRGQTLTELLAKDGPLELARVVGIFKQLLSAVEEAHSNGLIHRDLKPDNVMSSKLRSGEDFVKVLDFGIARLNTQQGSRLTMQGQLVGTPAYMSPEQIRGAEATVRSDLYACGAILYEMLVGHEPFRHESVVEVLSMHLHVDPAPLREAAPDRGYTRDLEHVLSRALAKNPDHRFASAVEFKDAVQQAVATGSPGVGCTSCGALVASGSRFCPQCGTPTAVAQSPAAVIGARSEMVGTKQTLASWSDQSPAADGEAPSHPPARAPRSEVYTTLQRRLRAEDTINLKLVGRDDELAAAKAFLAGDDRILEIIGEQGCGKTALLDKVAHLAATKGARVIFAESDPTLAGSSWHPVRKIVRQILSLGDDEVDLATLHQQVLHGGLLPEDVGGLAELVGLGRPGGAVEHAVRLRETRASALRALLRSKVGQQGLVLALDDAHLYDGASREFLRALAPLLAGTTVRLVIAGEKTVLGGAAPVVRIEPSALDPDAVRVLMGMGVPGPIESWLEKADQVVQRAGGRPLHVVQAIRLLAEGGEEVDASLPDIMLTRIGRLPTDALRLLQIICAVGLRAPLSLVQPLYRADDSWDDAVTLLRKRGFIVRENEDAAVVTHELIVESVREAMPVDARRRLHADVLAELERQGASILSRASHAFEAKLGERSIELLEDAAGVAEQWLDDAGAAMHYGRAHNVARWELLLDETDERCLRLALRTGTSLRYSGDQVGAELVLRDAFHAARGTPAVQSQLQRSLAMLELSQGNAEIASDLMKQAVGQAMFLGEPKLLTEMYQDLGKVLMVQGHHSEAAGELEEGVLMVTGGDGLAAVDGPVGFWRLLLRLAEVRLLGGRSEVALEVASAALRHARREGTLLGQARCHYLLGDVLERAGQPAAADEHRGSALAAFRRLGDRRSIGECLLARAASQPSRKLELVSEALELFRQVNWKPGVDEANKLLRQ